MSNSNPQPEPTRVPGAVLTLDQALQKEYKKWPQTLVTEGFDRNLKALFEATMLEIIQSARDEILMNTNLENRSEDFKHNFKVGMDEIVSKMKVHLYKLLGREEKS